MIKLKSILGSLEECVIARMNVDGNIILAKNRDRMYAPELEVIHELVNGVEMVYMHDVLTDWSEGMNSNGIGVLNASLSVVFDEKEGDLAKDKVEKGKSGKPSYDGLKIRTALSNLKLSKAMRSIIHFRGEDKRDVGVKGMTIISNPRMSFVIEMTSKHLPVITRVKPEETITRTNHGMSYPDAGYSGGLKRASSNSRMDISKKKLVAIDSTDEVLDTLSKQHVSDKFMNPYRRSNSFDIATSSQLLMDLTNLKFEFRHDAGNSVFKGYINRLPKNYDPKIKVVIENTTDL
tara:strand:- start:7078 stop:7950 length:873 start_codon:yes stop_codon:yes gene_type:complete